MDNLEKFVLENRDAFDIAPPEGHFERFMEKLETGSHVRHFYLERNFMLKIAAAILVLLTTFALVFDFTAQKLQASHKSASLPPEIQEAMNYYQRTTNDQLGEIHRLACCGQDLKSLNDLAEKELKSLDTKSEELKKNLAENPGNERVQAALIQNEQMKKSVMDNMIEKIKIAKGEK